MATSSAMTTTNQYINYTITVTQNSQSVTGNTSNVTVSVRFYRTNTGYTTYGNGTVYCTINGTTYTSTVTNSQQITNSGIVLFTQTLNIPHNADGTKTLTCSAYITHDRFSSSAQSYSQVLTTIPRKSYMTVANGTLGTAQTLTVSRYATSFTHTITYACGSASGTVCTKSTATSVSFTPPLTLASQNTTGTSVSITYTITTYSGSTSIGSNSYTVSCAMPASVKPSCSLTVTDPTGYMTTYGKAIQGMSKLTVTVTPTTSYSSPIAAYSTTVNGSTYTSASFTTDVLKTSGTLTVSSTVTDKRNRSGSTSKSVNVYAYNKPSITLRACRCDSDGTENEQGTYAKVVFSSTVTSLDSKNSAVYKLKYKASGATSYTTVTLSSYAGKYAVSNGSYKFKADTAKTFEIVVEVTDDFNTTQIITGVSTGYTLMSIGAEGRSVAFGKVSETSDYMDVNMNAKFRKPVLMHDSLETVGGISSGGSIHAKNGIEIDGPDTPLIDFHLGSDTSVDYTHRIIAANTTALQILPGISTPVAYIDGSKVADHVIETGLNSGWYYRKWASGIYECWRSLSITLSHYATISPFYGYVVAITYPITFTSVATINFQPQIGGGFAMPGTYLSSTATGANLYALSTSSGSQSTVWCIQIRGLWKELGS